MRHVLTCVTRDTEEMAGASHRGTHTGLPTMKATLIAGLAVLGLLLGTPAAASADDRIWVTVQGPNIALPEPRPAYTLEIGGLGWRIPATGFVGAGSPATVPASGPLVVRVRRLSDCAPVVSFVAKPGTAWIIRFVTGTSLRVEDWSKQALDMPGGMPAGGPLLCPGLPDTATADESRPDGSPTPVTLVGAAAGAAVALLAIRLRRRGESRRRAR